MRGDRQQAAEYRATAEEFAARWVAEADDGDHFRLAFDKPGTWSQKYNLVWDRVLGLNLFPEAVLRKEMDFYRKHPEPLRPAARQPQGNTPSSIGYCGRRRSRENRDDFARARAAGGSFLERNARPRADDRLVPNQQRRSVRASPRGRSWAAFSCGCSTTTASGKSGRSATDTAAGGYAKMPRPPKIVTHVAAADTSPATWRFTTERPTGDWQSREFDDSAWKQGESGFGTRQTPGTRRHGVEHAAISGCGDHLMCRRCRRSVATPYPPRRGRRSLHQRRARAPNSRIYVELRAASDQRRGPGHHSTDRKRSCHTLPANHGRPVH